MVLGRRSRTQAAAAAAVAVIALTIVGALIVSGGDGPPAPDSAPVESPVEVTSPAGPAPSPVVEEALTAGRPALVTVAVATVWNAPDVARPVDEPSLTNPVDVTRWIAAMSHDDKLWLVDRLVTQAVYGEKVVVREIVGEWARVVVTGQPSSLDPDGYPGWMPVVQLRPGEESAIATSAVVTRPTAALRDAADPAGPVLDLSYNTRLPVLGVGATDVTVALPTGGRGLLAASDVHVAGPGLRPTTAAELVAGARLFSGLPYLWAGTSSAGFD